VTHTGTKGKLMNPHLASDVMARAPAGRRAGSRRLAAMAAAALLASTVGSLRSTHAAEPANQPADPRIAEFEAAAQAVAGQSATIGDADIVAFARKAAELGRPCAANMAIKAYLARQPSPSADLLLAAAETARLAGDLRTAAARYKLCVAAMPADERRSQAAARLYEVLIDGLGNADDAYAFMTLKGPELRQSAAARKYDQWYLDQAITRRDPVGLAGMIAAVMADAMPLEAERLACWDRLDWLMAELARGTPAQFPALLAARRIVPLVRESPQRAARYAFIVAWLEYRAGAAGKEAAALAESFKPVTAAATAYAAAAPTAAVLADVLNVFLCGTNTPEVWTPHGAAIREWWVAAFKTLPAAEQRKVVSGITAAQGFWQYQATAAGWIELGTAFPDAFRGSDGAAGLPLLSNAPDPAAQAAQAAFLTGVRSDAAKIVNSLAATKGTDLLAGLQHLSRNESWYGGFDSVLSAVTAGIWPIWKSYPRQPAATDADFQKAFLAWAPESIARSPIPIFQPLAAQQYLLISWAAAGPDPTDKSGFIAHLRNLDWVPWDEKTRREVLTPVHNASKQWADQVRKLAAGPEKAKWEKAAAFIAPLEEEFRKAFDPAVSAAVAPAKLADPLAVHIAACVRAYRAKKLDDFLAAARQAYALVRDYPDRKTPFGQATLMWLLQNRLDAFDTVDFQCEVIADQMAGWAPNKPSPAMEVIDTAVFTGRPGWVRGSIPAAARPTALKFNAAIGKGILAQLQGGRFHPTFLDRHRFTRRGGGWIDAEAGNDVLAKLIDSKILLKTELPLGELASATANIAALVRSDYTGLATRYPPATAFDAMFVEEATAKGWFDWAFTNSTRDEKKTVANAAAARFATLNALATGPANPFGFDTLPLQLRAGERVVGGPRPFAWPREDLWNWHARALAADPPAAAAVAATAEAAWGKTRFDVFAMGRHDVPVDPAVMQAPQSRADYFKRLATYLDRGRSGHGRILMAPLNPLSQVKVDTLTADELGVLASVLAGNTPAVWSQNNFNESLGLLVALGLQKEGRLAELPQFLLQLWRIGRHTGNGTYQSQLAALAAAAAKAGHADVAVAIADCGIEMLGTDLPEPIRMQLATIRTEALLASGGRNPVPRSDPRWSIYEAQIAFAAGRPQAAWERYVASPAIVNQTFKDLDPAFVIWIIRENIQVGNFDRARDLAQAVLAWMEANPGGLDVESQAGMLVAYADIAMARKEYPSARALYDRIAAAKEFEGTVGRREAELRVAEVDRVTRQFDRANEILQKLVRRPDKTLQAEAYYQLAMLKADQDEIEESSAFLEQVFTRIPNHVNGRILEGNLNLRRRKYDVAAKVRLGVLGDRKFLIPGKPLEVDLEDKNLAVVGKATEIAIRAWTDSGDEERFNLFPFGDSKTRFSGQLPTQLAPIVKGDHVLQVAGGDKVHYRFADLGGAAQRHMAEEPTAMVVVTDSDIFASSGTILSKEEAESKALERAIRDRLSLNQADQSGTSLSTVRKEDQIKPGNRINVRVVDPDRSSSAEKDTLQVRASTASGDSLVVPLTETETHSGVFDGVVPTAASQATAFASDAADGNNPNWTISPQPGTAWIGQPDGLRPKWLAIDLNDNVELGTMTVAAAVPGRRLKDVFVQTSLNGKDFRTVGQWRADGGPVCVPWDGSPTMELVRYIGPANQPDGRQAFEDYLGVGRLARGSPLLSEPVKALAAKLDATLGGRSGKLGLDGVTNVSIGHWKAAFLTPKRQPRTFTIDPKAAKGVRYLLTIDGEAQLNAPDPLTLTRVLEKGPHRIDIYAVAQRASGIDFELLLDTVEPPFKAPLPESFFDAAEPEVRQAFAVPPAKITAAADGGGLTVEFGPATRARVVRLLMADFETDAPAVTAITLTDTAGNRVLPTQRSFVDLARNDVLEIIPGDKITIGYDDPTVITPGRASQQRHLQATYTNATVSAAFVEFGNDGRGNTVAVYTPMRRFKAGDTVKIFINDPDMDTSEEPDKVAASVSVRAGPPIPIEALETEPHSAVFIGTVFPVTGKPERDSEITVAPGDDLKLTYVDRENTDPGIPWERTTVVEQVGSEEPQLRVYDVASRPLDEQERAAATGGQPAKVGKAEQVIPVTRQMIVVRPEKVAAPGEPAKALIDGPLMVEVLSPSLAQSPKSVAEVFVQTRAGREKLGRPVGEDEFPIDAPGTIRLRNTPSAVGRLAGPPGVSEVIVRGDRFATDPLSDGRFTFLVQKELGNLPDESFAVDSAGDGVRTLQLRGDDTIYVGFRIPGPDGRDRWLVQKVELSSDAAFDVMDRRYQETVRATHVGDGIHLRLIDPGLDTSDAKDAVTVRVTSSSGGEVELPLTETLTHSGIFKGAIDFAYNDDSKPADGGPPKAAAGQPPQGPAGDAAGAEQRHQLPVAYGDRVVIQYVPKAGSPIERTVDILKGGDAELVPFTKQFNEAEIAVQTQFTVAEAWFELAKRHRDLGQEGLARREIAQGKKLLEEAINDYPNTQSRAQADYLLANLSFEFAKDAANADIARQHAMDAVARFNDIVSSYPESEYAPKSQYKKALVLEKLGQIDQACEEYVKLSYRYPDNELVAETIARLGQYFLSKGKEFDDQAASQVDPVEREKVVMQGREMFLTAAEVFGRLGERFPQHALASKTRMLSGQCYLRAKEFDKSLEVFEAVYKDEKTDKDLAAEAMYWAGDVSMQKKSLVAAYRAFKKLTWDYPESKWAKFARGRLTEPAMIEVDFRESRN
jgi:TolA-binding protein